MLPPEIEAEFRLGDFSVSRSGRKFANVDPDHAQEWLIGECKGDSGGIVGITRDDRTLQRWALTFYWRNEIPRQTYSTFKADPPNNFGEEARIGRPSARQKRDAVSYTHLTLPTNREV